MSVRISNGIRSRSFSAASGGTEHFISVKADCGLNLSAQIEEIEERYKSAQAALGLAGETAIFRRIFISDVMNQAAPIRESALVRATPESPVAVSLVQQAPLPGAKLALLAYHIDDDRTLSKWRLSTHDLLVEKNGRRHLWTTGLCAGETRADASPRAQTRAVFDDLIGTLASEGGTLSENCVRTWIYLKDVDVFYEGMVEARRAVFAEQGLTQHYIASTGIEGACAHRHDLVVMDAYSNLDLDRRQVSYLNDYTRLCGTASYNVHFERGTRIAYADRAHHFISGTASIDKDGQVVHPGDVLRQLDHALGNVETLLRSGAACLADLMHLIVYLRDPTDSAVVEDYLAERFACLPTMIVQGAVCRPQWLVEIEGIAIAANNAPALPCF